MIFEKNYYYSGREDDANIMALQDIGWYNFSYFFFLLVFYGCGTVLVEVVRSAREWMEKEDKEGEGEKSESNSYILFMILSFVPQLGTPLLPKATQLNVEYEMFYCPGRHQRDATTFDQTICKIGNETKSDYMDSWCRDYIRDENGKCSAWQGPEEWKCLPGVGTIALAPLY